MLVRYMGSRPSVSIVCSRRRILYFGPENNYTNDIEDSGLVSEVMSSAMHRFEITTEVAIEKPAKVKKEPEVKIKAPEPKSKRGRKKHG